MAFKKGPDYIDSAWLSGASESSCRNLDLFLMSEQAVAQSFDAHALDDGVNLIEGNRGLFDGSDPQGTYSTAELAKFLDAPVVLIVNCQKQTRTAAAFALGCRQMDGDVRIAGVILNRLATARQEEVIRAAIERDAGLKVLGAIPRMPDSAFHERRLGLTPPQEQDRPDQAIADAARMAEQYLDIEGLWQVAQAAPPLDARLKDLIAPKEVEGSISRSTRIGYFHDRAFFFYYPENLEAIERLGAKLIPIDPAHDAALPTDLDALYLGGGFPEENAPALAANESMRRSVRTASGEGLPIYAECGGLMYLGRCLKTDAGEFPMAGVFPVSFVVEERPQGHGYVQAEATTEHPFAVAGTGMKGHEFHYSRPVDYKLQDLRFGLRLQRGVGFDRGRDGLVKGNTFATYVHTHALGEPQWARSLIERIGQRCCRGLAPAGTR